MKIVPQTAAPESEGRRADPVDIHVGKRIRMRRKTLGVSQEQLASALGLTFQQVQKYEKGGNRVSASKLHGIGKFLGVPVAFFFEGLEEAADGQVTTNVQTLFEVEGGADLAADFLALTPFERQMVSNLTRDMSAQRQRGKAA